MDTLPQKPEHLELLEKASKAAGLTIRDEWAYDESWGIKVSALDGRGGYDWWNPLEDDGDALRLAVKLKIDIKQYDDHVVGWFDGGFIGTGKIMYEGEPYAATRRAVVLAAASLAE